jgi:hypothetical protein
VGEGGERFVDVAELALLAAEEDVADDASQEARWSPLTHARRALYFWSSLTRL